MSITRFKILKPIQYMGHANLRQLAKLAPSGARADIYLSILSATHASTLGMPVTVKQMFAGDSSETAWEFEGTTAGGRPFKGLYLFSNRAVRNPTHDEIEYGFIDVEVPDALGWDKDGSKVHLF
jgi:hypothetical protein